MLSEQANMEGDDIVEWIDKSEVSSESLQNPTDDDATYRKKSGKGYIGYLGHIEESFNNNGDAIVTGYDFVKNTLSDVDFTADFINQHESQEEKVQVMIDGTCYSEEMDRLGKEKNIELIPTALVGRKDGGGMAGDFKINRETKEIEECPAGHIPISSSYSSGRYRGHMEKAHVKTVNIKPYVLWRSRKRKIEF